MKGLTYFRWWGFSINESEVPNIHISWWGFSHEFVFYICWSQTGRFYWRLSYPKRLRNLLLSFCLMRSIMRWSRSQGRS